MFTRDNVLQWLAAFRAAVAENKDYLTDLDSAIGDADHGFNMDRGFGAVETKMPTVADKDIGSILKSVGMTLISTVGGAAGPLYGTLFMRMGATATDKLELSDQEFLTALAAGVEGVQQRGKAVPGEKTMLDALVPAVAAMRAEVEKGVPLCDSVRAAAVAAEEGMKSTIPLLATKGRASYLGERSIGHQDPGATSSYLLLKTAADVCETIS